MNVLEWFRWPQHMTGIWRIGYTHGYARGLIVGLLVGMFFGALFAIIWGLG